MKDYNQHAELLAYLEDKQPRDVDAAFSHLDELLATDPQGVIIAYSYASASKDLSLARSLLCIVGKHIASFSKDILLSNDWLIALALLLTNPPRDTGSEINTVTLLDVMAEHELPSSNPASLALARAWSCCCRNLLTNASKAVMEPIAEHIYRASSLLRLLPQQSAAELLQIANNVIVSIDDEDLKQAMLTDVVEPMHNFTVEQLQAGNIERTCTVAADILRYTADLLVDFREQAVHSKKRDDVLWNTVSDGLALLLSKLPSSFGVETGTAEHRVTLTTATRKTTTPTMASLGGVLEEFEAAVLAAVEFLFGRMIPKVVLMPAAAYPGSYVMDVQLQASQGSQGVLFAVLSLLERETPLTAEFGEALGRLLDVLAKGRTSIDIRPSGIAPTRELALTLDVQKVNVRREIIHRFTDVELLSLDVPQADDLSRVVKYVQLLLEQGAVDDSSLEVSGRQVGYYFHAARILGLVDSHQPLSAGKQLLRLDPDDRLRFLAACFEGSKCGLAWLKWANVKDLRGLDPLSAELFLTTCCAELSSETAHRRAQTLTAWCRELQAHHYAAPSLSGTPGSK